MASPVWKEGQETEAVPAALAAWQKFKKQHKEKSQKKKIIKGFYELSRGLEKG